MGAVDNYRRARLELIKAVANDSRNPSEVADEYGVHPTFVHKARLAMSVWGDRLDDDELANLSLDRLYYGAKLAHEKGTKKALELMRTKDSQTLRALIKGDRRRKNLPTVDEGLYEQYDEQYRRFAKIYYALTGEQLSHGRFIETLLGLVRELSDEAVGNILYGFWGDVYD